MKPVQARTALRILPLACLLAASPWPASAAGSMQHQRAKDFRELIVKGERPEIAACLVAAVDYARRSPTYFDVRWDEDASDRAIMQESESQGRLTRRISLLAQMQQRGPVIFSGTWLPVQIRCEQQQDGQVQITVQARAG